MSTTFYTKLPIDGDLDLNRKDIIFRDPEISYVSSKHWQESMTAAFKQADVKEGTIVYATVAYSDGRRKPGNVRNQRTLVGYRVYDGVEEVDLQLLSVE